MAYPLVVEDVLRRRVAVVDDALQSYVRDAAIDGGKGPLADAALHVLKAGGKRLRPALTLMACEAVGGEAARAVPAACGVELLHTFTLVHDDIMDGALLRRHRPTVEAVWGAPAAILTGDALFALAFRAFADGHRAPGATPAETVALVGDASRTSLRLARGQAMDLAFQGAAAVDVEEALEMVRLKTGALLAFALRAGGRVGGAPGPVVGALGRVGERLGEAFQLQDDLLDLSGEGARLGKPAGADVRGGKRTPLVAYALRALPPPHRTRLLEILDAPPAATDALDVSEAVELMERAGALAWTRDRVERLHGDALAALDDAAGALGPGGDAVAFAELRAVADFIATRRV